MSFVVGRMPMMTFVAVMRFFTVAVMRFFTVAVMTFVVNRANDMTLAFVLPVGGLGVLAPMLATGRMTLALVLPVGDLGVLAPMLATGCRFRVLLAFLGHVGSRLVFRGSTRGVRSFRGP
jgi:hypothetical protein